MSPKNILTELDTAFDSQGRFLLDGTRCSTLVVRLGQGKGKSEECCRPGRMEQCEFHYILRRTAKQISRYRGELRGPVFPRYEEKYRIIFEKLVSALKNDEERSRVYANRTRHRRSRE